MTKNREAARRRADRLMVMVPSPENADIRRVAALEAARIVRQFGFASEPAQPAAAETATQT